MEYNLILKCTNLIEDQRYTCRLIMQFYRWSERDSLLIMQFYIFIITESISSFILEMHSLNFKYMYYNREINYDFQSRCM